MKNYLRNYAVPAGLLLGSVALASANSLVTFQVDMSTATFDPATQTVSVHGPFNNWAATALTNNPTGENPYLWSGTVDIAGNGTVLEYKYVIDPSTWESIPKGNNRLALLPAANGASLVLPVVFYADAPATPATVDLTFQVDMAQQIAVGNFTPGVSVVYPKGTFNGWGTYDTMTNDPAILRTNQNGLVTSNVFVGTYSVSGSPGQTMDYKFYIDTGARYEDPAPGVGDPSDHNNRFFLLTNGIAQNLPIVFFSDAPYAPIVTNDVTFQVDLSAQVLNGTFDPFTSTVEVRGSFNSWGSQQIVCTNNPTASNTNIYSAVVRIVDSIGAGELYKFWASGLPNTGWEAMADNRSFKIVNATSQILPVVFFSNLSPGELLPVDTTVTFSLDMSNAVGTDSHVFDPASDTVYLNGVPNGAFSVWDPSLLAPLLNNPPGSHIYTVDYVLPKGSPVVQIYKYSINGTDNEAATNSNHMRVVRRVGTYAFPTDTFGNQYVEPSYGQLSVASAAAGKVPVSWLGRPGVHLQTASDLAGSWQDLLATDGATWGNGTTSTNGFVSVTNYPSTGSKTFFRLIKP